MQNPDSKSLTQLLIDVGNGDNNALNQILPLIYDELRRLAGSYMRRERADHTLQPTALVHEAYLRLIDQRRCRLEESSPVLWTGREHDAARAGKPCATAPRASAAEMHPP